MTPVRIVLSFDDGRMPYQNTVDVGDGIVLTRLEDADDESGLTGTGTFLALGVVGIEP